MSETVNIEVEVGGRTIAAPEGAMLLPVLLKEGFDIPHLCFHEKLKPYAACRLCLVEVEKHGRRKIATSCNYPVMAGLKVFLDTDEILEQRKNLLETMLAQAPDSEQVRKYAARYGVHDTALKKQEGKCIMCGLCVRACEEIVGAHAITLAGRGNFKTVDSPYGDITERCIACGTCATVCPTGHIEVRDARGRAVAHDELVVGPQSAVFTPTRQSVPAIATIDPESCIHMLTGGCGICCDVCEREAIDFDQKEETSEVKAGAVIVATGFEPFNPSGLPQLGYGLFDNVITAPQVEKMSNASGPTDGNILTAEGRSPESVAIVHCIGSRDKNTNEYCSKVCCMYSLKLAHIIHEKTGAYVTNFYIDIRAGGKGYEEFYAKVAEEGVRFIRGKVSEVREGSEDDPEESGKLVVEAEDTLICRLVRLPVDMVVLSVGLEARRDAGRLAHALKIARSKDGFFMERHIKLAPAHTLEDGIFIAGAAQGPKDIPESVSHGANAGLEALSLLDRREIELEASISFIDPDFCTGCGVCEAICPSGAISVDEKKKIAKVDETGCKGCGLCAAACPAKIADQRGFTERQISAEIDGLLII